MNRIVTFATCALLVCLAGLARADEQAASDTASGSSVVGAWKLNTDLSDTADRAAEGGRGAGGRSGGAVPPGGTGGRGGMGGGTRGGMGGFGGGRQPDRAESQRLRRIMQEAMQPPETLTIVLDGTHLAITAGDGRAFTYVTDGKKQDQLTGDGELKHKSKWNGAQLMIETEIQDGPKVTRTYAPSGDAQLIVTVKIEGGQAPRPLVVHHIYDRKG